jgi:uncharacterized membrane protein YccC
MSSVILAVSCLAAYWLVKTILAQVYSVSGSDDVLGGLWAVIATIFVCRDSREHSMTAALSRGAATSVSFVLCLAYLLIFPPSVWGMAILIAIGTLVVTLIHRPADAVTTSITTAVIMLVAVLSPHDPWQQPILRFFDTVVGIVVGLAGAWVTILAAGRLGPESGRAGAR